MTAIAAPTAPKAQDRLVATVSDGLARTNRLIKDRMQSDVPVIPALADHLIAAGGKRVRPVLTLAAAHLCADSPDIQNRAALLAAAVEFIHTATLLHDDVVDTSELRRGRTAAHLIWSPPSAILVGDFLFARAFELMVETGQMPALHCLSQAARVIAEGEVAQLSAVRNLDLGVDQYRKIIAAKTATLFSAATTVGAIAAEAPAAQQEALRQYGHHLGMAFQLADDALDYDGDSETLGKNVGDDLREGKLTLPLILTIARTPEKAAFWREIFADDHKLERHIPEIMDLAQSTGAVTDAWTAAKAEAETAVTALQSCEPLRSGAQPTAEDLAGLAYACAERRT